MRAEGHVALELARAGPLGHARFEPEPLQSGAASQRLLPLGQGFFGMDGGRSHSHYI